MVLLSKAKDKLKLIAKDLQNLKAVGVVLNAEHDVFALLTENKNEIDGKVDSLNERQVIGKYRLLHHALAQVDPLEKNSTITAKIKTINKILDVFDGKNVRPLQEQIETLLQDPVGKFSGTVSKKSLNNYDNRNLGEKTEQKLHIIGVRSQKQWDAIVRDDTRSALLLEIFKNAGFSGGTCSLLEKAINSRRGTLGLASQSGVSSISSSSPTPSTPSKTVSILSDSEKDTLHKEMMSDDAFINSLKDGLTTEQLKIFNVFIKATREKIFFKDKLCEAYEAFLVEKKKGIVGDLVDVSYKTHRGDFLKSDDFTKRKERIQKNIERGNRYSQLDGSKYPGGVVKNGGVLKPTYDVKNDKLTFQVPKSDILDKESDILDKAGRAYFDDDAKKSTTLEAKPKYLIVEKGGVKTSQIPLNGGNVATLSYRKDVEGADKVSVQYEIAGKIAYQEQEYDQLIELELPTETEELVQYEKTQLNSLLAGFIPTPPSNGHFDNAENDGNEWTVSKPLKLSDLSLGGTIESVDNAEISFTGLDGSFQNFTSLSDTQKSVVSDQTIYLRVKSSPTPKETRTGSVKINGKELKFTVETKDVPTVPVTITRPAGRILDEDTGSSVFVFEGTGENGKSGKIEVFMSDSTGKVPTGMLSSLDYPLNVSAGGNWKQDVDFKSLDSQHYLVKITINGQTQEKVIERKEKETIIFDIQRKDNVEIGAKQVESDPFEVKGLTAGGATATCSGGGELSNDNGVTRHRSVTVNPGQKIIARGDASGSALSVSAYEVTVGGEKKNFVIKTKDKLPDDPVLITKPINTAINTKDSNFEGTGPKGVKNGTISICVPGTTTPLRGYTQTGVRTNDTDGSWSRTVHFDGLASGGYDVIVTIGTQTDTLPVQYTKPASLPLEKPTLSVEFDEEKDQELNSRIDSKEAVISGLTAGPVPVTLTNPGSQIVINDVPYAHGSPIPDVKNTDRVKLRVRSSTAHDTPTSMGVVIGGLTNSFRVITKKAPELPTFPSFTEPGLRVTVDSPLTFKGTLSKGEYVQLQSWDATRTPPDWVNEGPRLSPDPTSRQWELKAGKLPFGTHQWRAVPCFSDGSLCLTQATHKTFDVVKIQTHPVSVTRTRTGTPPRVLTNLRTTMDVAEGEPMEIGWRKKSTSATPDPLTGIVNITPASRTYDFDEDLELPHGDYELVLQSNAKKIPVAFTIDPMPIAVDMNRLPTSQQRNPIFYGTAEPGENVEVFYKKPGSKPTDPAVKIPTKTNSRGEWNFVLDDTIQGTYELEVQCAGQKETIRYVSEGVSRAPQLDETTISVREDHDFTISGYINRNELDCEAVGIFRTVEVQGQLKQVEIVRVPLGARQSLRNITTRNSSRDSSFEYTLPASLIKEYDSPETLIVKPIKHGGVIDDENVSTLQVTKTQDLRNAPREALRTAGVEFNQPDGSKPQVTLSGKVTQPDGVKHKIKKIGVRRHTRGAGSVIKREYQTVGVNDDGTRSVEKLFTTNGKYTYAAAPIIDAEPISGTWLRKSKEVLGKTFYCPFEVQSEVNAGRSKRYNPLSRKMPWSKKKKEGKEGSGAGAGSGGTGGGGDTGGDVGSSSNGGGLFKRTRQWWKRALVGEDALERQYKKWTAKPA